MLTGQHTDFTAEKSRSSDPLLRCYRSCQRQHLTILPPHLPRPIHHDSRLDAIRLCHGLLDRRSFRQHLQLQPSQCQLGARGCCDGRVHEPTGILFRASGAGNLYRYRDCCHSDTIAAWSAAEDSSQDWRCCCVDFGWIVSEQTVASIAIDFR
jgi:hypothetical protein